MTKRAVAVVAIHGVADQQPGSSVRSVGDLLLRLRSGGREVYRGFRELALRLPLQPVAASPRATTASRATTNAEKLPTSGSMNERPAYVLDALRAPSKPEATTAEAVAGTTGAAPAVPPHHLFQRSLLDDYEASRGTYDTLRLEGERAGDGRPIHLYEVYWADLSRIGQGLVAILGAFYQLALHLPYLGRLTIDHALFEHPGEASWRWFARVHAWAVRVLTLLLPILVLLQLFAVLGLLPGAVPGGLAGKRTVAFVALAVAGVAVGGLWRYHRRSRSRLRTWLWSAFPLLTAAACVALGWLLLCWRRGGAGPLLTADQLLMLLWIALSSVACFALFGVLDGYRPGARRWGTRLWVPYFLLPMLYYAFAGDAGNAADELSRLALASGVLKVFELQLNVALLVAFSLYLLALLSGALGVRVVLREKEPAARRRARRVAWTALVTLALATVLFYLGTLLLGTGALYAARPLLPGGGDDGSAGTPSAPHEHLAQLPWTRAIFEQTLAAERQKAEASGAEETPPAVVTQATALGYLLRLGATSGITVLVMGFALVLFLTAWGLAPAVWKEVRGPTGERATEARGSESLGRWLDRAYGALAGVMVLLFLVAFFVSPVVSLLRLLNVFYGVDVPLLATLWEWNGRFLAAAGAIVAASAVGLAFHGRLQSLALGFRPVLDVALDVDGYLRHLPSRSTPRARMFERYASLLRYLTTWRDAEGRGYEAVVLVAHSQGTVLTADLLDFLCREPDPTLPWIHGARQGAPGDGPRLRLFTMGSPLAQLYARNFPHLYGWISGEPPGWFPPRAPSGATFTPRADGGHHTGHELAETLAPEPARLGVERWVNAYRSGDYVGRTLWRGEGTDDDVLWLARHRTDAPPGAVFTVSEDAAGRRRELCLGSGAHTHYWDSTADAVAFELDLLIART